MENNYDGVVFGKASSKKVDPKPSTITALPDKPEDGIVWGKPQTKPKTVYQEDQERKAAIDNGILPLSIAGPLRGASFGLSDKAASAIKSLAQHGDLSEYRDNLDRQQKQEQAFSHNSPYQALGQELGGSLLTGGAEARLAAGAFKSIPGIGPAISKFADRVVDGTGKVISGGGATPWLTRLAGNAANTGTLGAIDAAGRSNIGAEGQQVKDGALLGAGFGTAAHIGMGALSSISHSIKPLTERALIATGIRSPEEVARKLFFDHLQTLGDTPESIVARMNHMNNANEIHPGNVPKIVSPQQDLPPSATFAGSSGGGGPTPSGAAPAGVPGAGMGVGAPAPIAGTHGGTPAGQMLTNPLYREGEQTIVPGNEIEPYIPKMAIGGQPPNVPAENVPFYRQGEQERLAGPGNNVPAENVPFYHQGEQERLAGPENQNNVSNTIPVSVSQKTIEDLRSQGYTKDQAESQAAALVDSYKVPNKPVIVADAVNGRTQALLKTAVNINHPGQENVVKTLTDRANEQKNRLNLDLSTNISPDTGLLATVADIDSKYRDVAAPLYDKVRQVPTAPDQKTADFFNQDKTMQQFLGDFSANRARGPNPMSTLFKQDANGNYTQGADGFENVPSMSDLIELRKELASQRSSLWDDTTGKYKAGDAGKATIGGTKLNPLEIKGYMNQLDDILSNRSMDGTMNPDGSPGSMYRKALDIHSDGESIKTAADIGGKISNPSMTSEAFQQHFDNLDSDAERSAMRSGATSSLANTLGTGGLLINKVAGRANSTNLSSKLNTLGLNDEGNSLLNNSLSTERIMQDTNRNLFPRSASPDLLPNAQGTDSIPGMGLAATTGHWGSFVNGARNLLSGKGNSAIPDVAEHLSDIGMMNPNEFESYIKQYDPNNKTAWDGIKSKFGALSQYAQDGVPAAIGSEMGGLANDPSYYGDDGILHLNIKGLPAQ